MSMPMGSSMGAGARPFLTGYSQAGVQDARDYYSNGVLTVPLDGRSYAFTLTANTTVALGATQSVPICGMAVIVVTQAASGGPYTLSYPATWQWAGKVAFPMPSAASARAEITLRTDPNGNVVASGCSIGTVS
jgi:hypothetical protein